MQRGFGLISVLISLLIVSALTGVILQSYYQSTVGPLTRDLSGESVRPDQGARLAEAQALLSRCDASGGPPPSSPSSGQGC